MWHTPSCKANFAHADFSFIPKQGDKDESTLLVTLLKSCTKSKNLFRGSLIHECILRKNLLTECSDALVTMYAKCGELAKAKDLFNMHTSKDVRSWTALIGGYAQKGQGHLALKYFDRMQSEGLSPDVVTFVCVLTACGAIGAAKKGEEVHDEIAKQGMLGNGVLGNALVDMYAKCGALAKARQVLENLPVRDVISWNTLITGYVQQGNSEEALNLFEIMQHEGISPNAVTFSVILKACGSIEAVDKGECVHDLIAKQGLLGKNFRLGTALVDMYAKSGAFHKAQQVLEELSIQDVSSWNALIAGYAQQGEGEKALRCYKNMQTKGLVPDAVTYTAILKGCGCIQSAEKGEKIHEEATKRGLLKTDVLLGNAVVDMYVKCGALATAWQVLEGLPLRNDVSWNVLITGYSKHGENEEVLNFYEAMLHEGLRPDVVTFTCILKACGSMAAAEKGERTHIEIVKMGMLENNLVLGTALLDMYAKCGALSRARQVHEDLCVRNVVSWNTLISGYLQYGKAEIMLDCHEEMQGEGLAPDSTTFCYILKACSILGAAGLGHKVYHEIVRRNFLGNCVELETALVDMYAKCGALAKAGQVLESLPAVRRDAISWNALIAGCVQEGNVEQALRCYDGMQNDGFPPDAVTFLCLLKACGSTGIADKGQEFFCQIIKQGLLGNDIRLGTAVADMYAKCGALWKAQQVLADFYVVDLVAQSALILRYAQWAESEEAMHCFEAMQNEGICPNAVTFSSILKACGSIGAADKGEAIHDEIVERGLLINDAVLGTALVNMYAKCGAFGRARQVLEGLPVRDVSSWNALLVCYSQHGEAEQAQSCYEEMRREGHRPDAVTFSCMLKACGCIGAAVKGEQIHHEIAKQGMLEENVVLGNALIDMYAKCGALAKARRVLEELQVRNVISWNSLIAGYAQGCEGVEALNCLEQMEHEGLSPDIATFSSVLSACARVGLVENVQMLLMNMSTKHGLKPDLEHYTCMIDLFGRAGFLEKAVRALQMMPLLDPGVWCALLYACRKWGDVYVGKWAFDGAIHSLSCNG